MKAAARSPHTPSRIAVTVGLLVLFMASDGLAQSGGTGFGGRWIRTWPVGLTPPATATTLLTVTVTGALLTVEERSSDGHVRTVKRYSPQPAWTPDTLTTVPARAFQWLAADRLELRDVVRLRSGNAPPTALREVWAVSADGSTLQIQRQPPARSNVAAPATQLLTFERQVP